MAKAKAEFECQSCGAVAPKWTGQCADCGAWNSLVEAMPPGAPVAKGADIGYAGESRSEIVEAEQIEAAEEAFVPTGLSELDRVLGGGLVEGSAILLGGDPGIGKSTLLLQAAARLSGAFSGGVVYVTGEESLRQVMLRAKRAQLPTEHLKLLAETQVERILALVERDRPRVLIVDSIQTAHSAELNSAPGGVAQVRQSASLLIRYAKQTRTALFLVGHVTKEGALAGPRVLEHMVDTVLYFESEANSRFRVIRAVKNRFGAVNELGIFAMTDRGLREVANPSAMLLSRNDDPVPGSVVMVTREGTRPLLVEVQALVDGSSLGNPRRVTVGLEQNRLAMLLAVLNRHGGIVTSDQDVFVNVVGGVRVTETGADLALLAAVVSSLRSRALARDIIVFGEVGLAGEVRPVAGGEDRLGEAAKHGFRRAIVPEANTSRRRIEGLEVVGVTQLSQALEAL
ncbi:MAG: DNA repair protein RadA [Gammaproteobacteria bacterium]|nr:DNA repair protein RadA [Gammaproteobacteria bacterium]